MSVSVTVTVRLFAVFRERLGQSSPRITVGPEATVATVWDSVMAERPDLEPLRSVTRFAVNGAYADSETPVREGDEVAFLPPMSGGSIGLTPPRIAAAPLSRSGGGGEDRSSLSPLPRTGEGLGVRVATGKRL